MNVLFVAWPVLFLVTITPLLSGRMITDVRLVNGSSIYEGTVEYTTDNNTWQTTCGVYFGFDDARLVCEHIGAYGTNRAITNSPFGSDLDQPTTFLDCQKGHTSISDCGLESSCSSPDMIGAAACYDETYLGCYMDDNTRVLPGDPLQGDNNTTIDKCISHCRESTVADYVYAGVEYGEECYCGVTSTNYSRLGAAVKGDEDCQSSCTGDANSSCGGSGHIAVFQITEPLTTTTGDIVKSSQASAHTSKPRADSSSTDGTSMSSSTPAVALQVGETSNLGLVAGAGGGTIAFVIILVVIFVIVFLYKRRAARKAPLPDQPSDKFDANNYDEILMDSTLDKGEPRPPHRYEDSINAVVNKEPQLNMGFAKDEEDLSALYAVSTNHRPEAEGADLGDLYAMPDKRKKSHVIRNGASKAMEPSTQESPLPGMDALYAIPDKKKKATDDDEEDSTEMVENPIYR